MADVISQTRLIGTKMPEFFCDEFGGVTTQEGH